MNKTVTILSFSTRNNGNCASISSFIEQYYMRTNVFSFKIDSRNFSPCGSCDYECLKSSLKCPQLNDAQIEIMNAVCRSDLVYYIVPNYCGYPCSNYFSFNERSVGYFNMDTECMNRYMSVPKRFIVVSNSQDKNFVNTMRQQTNEEPDILYLQSKKYQKRSIAGDLLDSNAAKIDLAAYLARDNFL